MRSFVFPEWTNTIRPIATLLLVGGVLYVIVLAVTGLSGKTTNVGYQPIQPVPYSHALHAGDLGIDCRYCHNTVEKAAYAALPPTQTCMNCHKQIRSNSPKLIPVRESYATGMPIPWVKVHDLPDYAYFNHSAHVSRGIGCVSCHGRIDKMEVVSQDQPLTMGWCLDCHRHPERSLRPVDQVTKMDYVPAEDQLTLGRRLREANHINPPTDCSTCHR
jgi:menaquinone reductase, multiheme cytochrome c subunit